MAQSNNREGGWDELLAIRNRVAQIEEDAYNGGDPELYETARATRRALEFNPGIAAAVRAAKAGDE